MINLADFYSPFEKQIAFHNSTARNRLLVGGAGSGKSIALLWEAIKWCYRWPGVQVLLLRRTFPELEKGLIKDLRAMVPPKLYRWNDAKHIATFDVPHTSPSMIFFGHLEGGRESTLAQYLSSAFPLIAFDEAGQFTYKAWEFLSSRNRVNVGCKAIADDGTPIQPGMAAATNPLGPGWGWLTALFINKKPNIETVGDARLDLSTYNPNDYWYIHSTVLDNPVLLERDPTYLKKLQNLRPAMREKLLYGNLDSVSGQYFTVFEPSIHVVPPSALEFQPWERAWIGLDWGLSHFTAIFWFTRAKHLALNKSVTVVYREKIFNETSLEDAASIMHAEMKRWSPFGSFAAERKALTSIFASHELFARRSDPQKTQTIAAEFSRHLHAHGLPGLVKAVGSANREERVRGAVMLYEDLAHKDFFVLNTCPQVAETIPLLTRDENDIEDVLKTTAVTDDIFDGLKHGILSVSLPRSEPEEHKVAAHAATIPDPLSRWLYLTKQKHKHHRWTGTLWERRGGGR